MDRQTGSKDLQQLDLPISRPARMEEVADIIVARQPNLTAAINLCINASGLEDKEIYIPLKIDPGHWTRIRQGSHQHLNTHIHQQTHRQIAHFPVDKLIALMDLCGNDIPLRWLNLCRGQRTVPIESAQDARIKILEEHNNNLQKEIDILIKYSVIRRATE